MAIVNCKPVYSLIYYIYYSVASILLFVLYCYVHVQLSCINPDMNGKIYGSLASTLGLAAISIESDMNRRICGALLQFGCYQHRHA